MNCNDEPCFQVRGKISDFDEDVDILSIKKVTLNWVSNDPITGSEQDVAPDQIDANLKEVIKGHLTVVPGYLIQSGECPVGCYCKIPATALPLNSSAEEQTVEFNYMYISSVRWVFSVTDEHNPNPDPTTLADAKTGQPGFNSETEFLGKGTGMQGMGLSFPVFSRFEATVSIKISIEKFELHGECKDFRNSSEIEKV